MEYHGPGVLLSKRDIRGAYRYAMMAPSNWHIAAESVPGGIVVNIGTVLGGQRSFLMFNEMLGEP